MSTLDGMNISYKDLLKKCSKQLIEEDGKTLNNIVLSVCNDGMILLALLPYFALYCRSVQEFFGETIIESDVDKQINDLRNGLKIFSGKFSKGSEAALNSDKHQNKIFKDMLRFEFMKSLNVHYNLGVYIDAKGHIIGDTQILDYFLNCPSTCIDDQKIQAYTIGNILGYKMRYILNDLCGVKIISTEVKIHNSLKYGYMDMNTNIKCDFFAKQVAKELNLIILHILSSIGFVEHVLIPMLPNGNLWALRIEYIAAHYAWSGLKKVKQHYDNNGQETSILTDNIDKMIDNGAFLFPSSFRNCMMHYDLCNKENVVILEKYYDDKIPLYGLVESCFVGKSYEDFSLELKHYVKRLEEYLLSWFQIDINKVKWDL